MARIENKVQELRRKAGLTQEELAGKAGVTRQTIIAIERGNYAPSVVLALRLAHILKTTVEQLFTLV
ncbi:MAG TPA: helix-turn-helix transcriptional regulator [Candidatus Paceibacterota bacterium]|nr:helix-turn-helix transcriptional regulator [Candidatus Paceibacterota bacterium]